MAQSPEGEQRNHSHVLHWQTHVAEIHLAEASNGSLQKILTGDDASLSYKAAAARELVRRREPQQSP